MSGLTGSSVAHECLMNFLSSSQNAGRRSRLLLLPLLGNAFMSLDQRRHYDYSLSNAMVKQWGHSAMRPKDWIHFSLSNAIRWEKKSFSISTFDTLNFCIWLQIFLRMCFCSLPARPVCRERSAKLCSKSP